MKSDWERITEHFEANTVCKLGNKPYVHYEPGVCWVACDIGTKCKCAKADGDGLPLSQFLGKWQKRFC